MMEQYSSTDIGTLFFVGVFSVAFFIYQAIKPLKLDKDLPGPEPHFLLGNVALLTRHRHHWPEEVARLNNIYKKKTWGATFPRLPGSAVPHTVLFTADEVNLKYVLHGNFKNYVKGKVIEDWLGDWLGEGVFVVDGPKWKVHRKLMSNMFSRNLLRYSAAIMKQKLLDILGDMKNSIDASATVRETSTSDGHCRKYVQIDFKDLMSRLFFDVTSVVAFGVDLNTVLNDTKEIHPFFTAFDKMVYLFDRRSTDFLFPIKRMLGIGSERVIAELICQMDDFAMNLIAERRMNMEKGIHSNPVTSTSARTNGDDKDKTRCQGNFDLLTKYIEYAQKANEDLSNKELKDVIVNVMFAGRDTSSSTMSWAFYELERNLDVKEKVVREVASICGTGADAEYSFETMNELKYTHSVILEVLRLHPVVPENIRHAVNADTLPDGTRVPPGAGVAFSPYTMGRNEDVWGKDAAEFKPERFFGENEPSSFKFPAFHAGPRICIGKPLALINMKMVLSILLSSDIEFEDRFGHSGDYNYAIIMSMKDSFPMEICHRREPKSTNLMG